MLSAYNQNASITNSEFAWMGELDFVDTICTRHGVRRSSSWIICMDWQVDLRSPRGATQMKSRMAVFTALMARQVCYSAGRALLPLYINV